MVKHRFFNIVFVLWVSQLLRHHFGICHYTVYSVLLIPSLTYIVTKYLYRFYNGYITFYMTCFQPSLATRFWMFFSFTMPCKLISYVVNCFQMTNESLNFPQSQIKWITSLTWLVRKTFCLDFACSTFSPFVTRLHNFDSNNQSQLALMNLIWKLPNFLPL